MFGFKRYLRFNNERPLGPALMLMWMRALALVFLWSGISYWSDIIGSARPTSGFAVLPVQWQVATVYFSVLSLVAAVGLWCGAGWGVAAWLFIAVTEIVMHLGFTDLFGTDWPIVAFHFSCIAVYVALARWAGAPENTSVRYSIPDD